MSRLWHYHVSKVCFEAQATKMSWMQSKYQPNHTQSCPEEHHLITQVQLQKQLWQVNRDSENGAALEDVQEKTPSTFDEQG